MDLTHLYHRHGVALIMAAHASCESSRAAHETMANAYASRISETIGANRRSA